MKQEVNPTNDGSTSSPNGDDTSGAGNGNSQARFGTFGGVFTPCVLTILGVIMFMRTGYVVGEAGVWYALAILAIAKAITTLTTLSLSAIATNIEMRVGGVYFMISRVLGPDFGGSIGITLFIAQAVSVAFYTIGFTEALLDIVRPVISGMQFAGIDALVFIETFHLTQVVSTVVVALLFFLTFKGADLAIKAQYFVLLVLLLAVASFLVGGFMHFDPAQLASNGSSSFSQGSGFWVAFAIFFPAATGITAGANMSGDLKNPGKSIPWGTLIAIGFTAAIYVIQIFLTAGVTPRDELKQNAFIALQQMSVFGPLIIAGVFAATLSSALGSFLGAPRILQAMGQDRLMKVMIFFGKGSGTTNEPRRATVLTFAIAVGVIWAGDLNAVAEVISMFFLIAYGMINLSAFVESRGGNPSFRPRFRFFSWGTGLTGAVGCTIAMVKINETYALIALGIVAIIYFYLKKRDIKTSYGDAKRGFIFQRTRDNLLYLEQSKSHPKNWRPVLVALTEDPFRSTQLIRMGSWLESRRGLYTVAQLSERPGSRLGERLRFSKESSTELQRFLRTEDIVAFSETVVVNEFYEGLITFLQSYSIGGLRPNTILAALPESGEPAVEERFTRMISILATFNFNLVLLKTGEISPSKKKRTIDLWWRGEKNGSLMSLFAYLMKLDRTWSNADLRILRIVRNSADAEGARRHLEALREQTRIAAQIDVIESQDPPLDVIARTSGKVADLVMMGMSAAGGDDVRRYLVLTQPVLGRLPTTVMIWSNGEADVFA